MHPSHLTQDLIGLTPGASYVLTFRTYFDKRTPNEGFVGARVGNDAGYTVDACDFGAGAYKDNRVVFTASASSEELRFDIEVLERDAVVKIDNVVVVPAA